MRITILGCGTSTGVPVLGCRCGVCTSKEARNKRTRSSIIVHAGNSNILIDTSTDLRTQSLANGIEHVDAVLYTHAHADHICGIDDLRSFNLAQKSMIPCFGSAITIARIKTMFDYIFSEEKGESWKPDLTATAVDAPFEVCGHIVTPVPINHGTAEIFGYRIGGLAYLTDCSAISDESFSLLAGINILILGALRHKPHPTHFSIDQAIAVSQRLSPERTFFTHLGHSLDYTIDNERLPAGCALAYDGMTIEL